jgi:hypothetical protein
MSIKRVKQATKGTRRDQDSTPSFWTQKEPERTWDWAQDVATQPDDSFAPYALTTGFAKGGLVLHTKFGKGVVTQVDGPNIDVLFEEGPKRLRHTPALPAPSPH